MLLIRNFIVIILLAGTFDVWAVDHAATIRFTSADRSYSFAYPAAWSVENIPQMNGILLMAHEQEGNWQANMFFEIRTDEKRRDLAKAISDLIPNLRLQKAGFKLLRSSDLQLIDRRRAALIEYTCYAENIDITEWEVLIPMQGNNILFVVAATTTSLKRKYQPFFDAVLKSIRVDENQEIVKKNMESTR